MKFEYYIAARDHCFGAEPEDIIWNMPFYYFSEALREARSYENCFPTIYFVVDKKYIFYVDKSKVDENPYRLFTIKEIEKDVRQEISIDFKKFLESPERFLKYALLVK